MVLTFTETQSKNVIAINSDHIVAVFEALEGEIKGKTVISVVNGSIVVDENLVTVLGQLKAV